MSLVRKIELGFGIATVILALIVSASMVRPSYIDSLLLQILGAAVFFVAPALLVAVGSYLRAAEKKALGYTLLWVGGLFLTVMLFVHAFGGVFYLYGLWGGLGILIPSVTAVMTLIASLLVKDSP
jgi:hypothetical protein